MYNFCKILQNLVEISNCHFHRSTWCYVHFGAKLNLPVALEIKHLVLQLHRCNCQIHPSVGERYIHKYNVQKNWEDCFLRKGALQISFRISIMRYWHLKFNNQEKTKLNLFRLTLHEMDSPPPFNIVFALSLGSGHKTLKTYSFTTVIWHDNFHFLLNLHS